MTSAVSVDVMSNSGAVVAASDEGAYAQMDAAPSVESRSRLLVGAGIAALTLLLTGLVALSTYLLLASSDASSAAPSPQLAGRSVSSNSSSNGTSQYGSYPMLYEDPRNQWTPADGFLFNMSSVDIDLNDVELAQYRGNITLVTNVASF